MEQDSLVAEEGIECIQHIIGLVTNDELVKEEGEQLEWKFCPNCGAKIETDG